MKKNSGCLFGMLLLLATPRFGWSEQAEDRGDRVRSAEEQLDAEPTLNEVRRAALHHFAVSPRALDRVRELTRSKASVPYLIMGTEYDGVRAHRTLRGVPRASFDADDHFGSNVSTSLLTIAWDFPSTVFSPAELQTYHLGTMQQEILRAINRIYFYRRQLLLVLLVDPPTDSRARDALRMRVEAYTALLNAYTGGWFVNHLPSGSI